MRALLLALILGAAMSAQGQSGGAAASGTSQAAAAQTGQSANVNAGEATQVSAELTKNLDSKKAKVGDEVLAKTTSKARLTDGTMLPKGTKLVGKVTDVQAKAGAEHASRLAFAFDHAVLHDGSQVPVHATLQSISAPSAATTSAGVAQDDSMAAGPVGASAGGGARSGGMIGGAAGGVARPIGGAVGSTTRGVEDTAAGAESTVGGAVQGTSASAGVVTGSVANLPGVTFSSTASGNGEAVLQGSGRNIELSSGTQMSLGVTATH
jgi:hypothetical protein